jgi:hypothetical protein
MNRGMTWFGTYRPVGAATRNVRFCQDRPFVKTLKFSLPLRVVGRTETVHFVALKEPQALAELLQIRLSRAPISRSNARVDQVLYLNC